MAEPGTKYVYSSYGYNLLAAVVEGAAGVPFGEFMQHNVWGPLAMTGTRLDNPTDLIPNRARGYRLLEGLDDIGLTLRHADLIEKYESGRPSFKPKTLPAKVDSTS